MSYKNWKCWDNPSITVDETQKLFNFIKSWDRFFRGDIERFRKIYAEIFPILQEFKNERIEEINLNSEMKTNIRDAFDKIANCTLDDRCESTDASKILHTIFPEFFIMWDEKIRDKLVNGGRNGAVYAFYFLPKMKAELDEAIETCMEENMLTRENAIEYIQEKCDGKKIPKIIDEFNYVKFTKKSPLL